MIQNHISGFDEEGCAALVLAPDRAGREYANLLLRNIFERCDTVVKETGKGLWASTVRSGNVFIGCGGAPDTVASGGAQPRIAPVAVAPPKDPELVAPRLEAEIRTDGDVAEWTWNDATRIAVLERTPGGDPVSTPRGYACAAHDDGSLYLAMRFELPEGTELEPQPGFDRGDGIEVSFKNTDPEHPTPILLLWGSAGGTHESSPAMGASAPAAERLREGTAYAARKTDAGWSCEWRIPFSAMGLKAADVKTLYFNLGLRCMANDSWTVWTPTGGRVCDVVNAGKLQLKRAGK